MTKPTVPSALQQAGEVFEALGSAQGRAAEAMKTGKVSYDRRLGFAQQNLLECWLYYTAITRLTWCRGEQTSLRGARQMLRRAKGQYRQLRAQHQSGIVGRLEAAE